MKSLRVLVCGGRDFTDKNLIFITLNQMRQDISMLITGGARGADAFAGVWARVAGVPVRRFYADWETHGKSAGFIRNAEMLKEGRPDLVVAFHGGKGTAHMKQIAERAGVRVMSVQSRRATPSATLS